jgi:hypothetical protein
MTVKAVTALEGARKAARLSACPVAPGRGTCFAPRMRRDSSAVASEARRLIRAENNASTGALRRKTGRRRREAALPPQLTNTRLDAHFDCSTLRHSFVEWRSVRRSRETARPRGGSAA